MAHEWYWPTEIRVKVEVPTLVGIAANVVDAIVPTPSA